MLTVLFGIIIFLSAYGVGAAACRFIGGEERLRSVLGPIFLPVLRLSIGSGLMALLALFLAAAQIVSPVLLNILNLGFAILGGWLLWKDRSDFRFRNFSWKRGCDTIGFLIVIMLAGFYCWLTWNPLLLIDTWAYHITMPKQYLLYGGVFSTPYELHPNLHFLSEFFLMWGLALDANDFILAKFPQVFAMFGTSIAIISYFRRHGRYMTGWFVGIMYLLHDEAVEFAPSAHVDLSLANCLVLGLLVLVASVRAHNDVLPRLLIIAGMLYGFAIGTKTSGLLLTAVIGGVCFLFLIAVHSKHSQRSERLAIRRYLSLSLFFGVACGLVAVPWILKNLHITGSPLYPFMIDRFPPRQEYLQVAVDFHRIYGNFAGYSLLDLEFYRSFVSQLYHNLRIFLIADQGAWLGIFMIGILAYLLRVKPRLNARANILAVALILFPLVVLSPARRFVIAPAVIVFMAGMLGAVAIVPRQYFKKSAFIIIVGIFGLLLIVRQFDRQWNDVYPRHIPRGEIPRALYLTSASQRAAYLDHHDRAALADKIESIVGPSDRILITKINPVLAALNVRVLPLLNIHGKKIHQLMMDEGKSEQEVRAALHDLEITHVLVGDEVRTIDDPGLFINWDE